MSTRTIEPYLSCLILYFIYPLLEMIPLPVTWKIKVYSMGIPTQNVLMISTPTTYNNLRKKNYHLLFLGDSSYSFPWCKISVNSNARVSAPETNTQVRKIENCSNCESQSHQQIDSRSKKNATFSHGHSPNKICNNLASTSVKGPTKEKSLLPLFFFVIRKLPQRIEFHGAEQTWFPFL